MDPHIVRHLTEYEFLREQLRTQFPEADEETILDTAEGLSSLPEMLARVVRSQLDDQALATALRTRISAMQDRLARLDDRAEKKRGLVACVMERAGIRKLTEPEFTASLRPTPASLIIIDEAEIPNNFWKPQPPKFDRKGLLSALSAGQTVAGATLGNGGITIAVRTS
jgi:hypothetical protein